MSGYKVSIDQALRVLAVIDDPDPALEGFDEWQDTVHATWNDRDKWWELTGANMGAGNGLIVHPYQIDALIGLLSAMREAPVGDGS